MRCKQIIPPLQLRCVFIAGAALLESVFGCHNSSSQTCGNFRTVSLVASPYYVTLAHTFTSIWFLGDHPCLFVPSAGGSIRLPPACTAQAFFCISRRKNA